MYLLESLTDVEFCRCDYFVTDSVNLLINGSGCQRSLYIFTEFLLEDSERFYCRYLYCFLP